jgi:hypothetical protein
MAGFYPVESPGGWQLVGRTDATLWNPWRDPPNLIAPGDTIALLPTEEPLPAVDASEEVRPMPSARERIAEVTISGQLDLLVPARDDGRLRHGLSPGGPFDEEAAAVANAARPRARLGRDLAG